MKKFLLIALTILIHSYAFCQSYDVKFKIAKEGSEKMGVDWDYKFTDAPYTPPYYVEFNGDYLKISNSTKVHINKKVSSIKVNENKKTIYGKEVITSKDIILGVKENEIWNYYILKYMYLESGGYAILLYCPYITKDGMVYSYNIYQSEILN